MALKLNLNLMKVCVLVALVLLIWQTYRILTFSNPSHSLTKIQSDTSDGSTQMILLPASVIVYYEALCPDSRSFFLRQLLPTYEKIPSLLDVTLVPYGKATTLGEEGSYEFECQHGAVECLANKVHACGAKLIADQGIRLRYAACMIDDNMNPEAVGSSCAKKFDVNWSAVWSCARGEYGSELLADHGLKTDSLGKISFVPTISLQDSTDRQPGILKDLFKEICRLYTGVKPEGCK